MYPLTPVLFAAGLSLLAVVSPAAEPPVPPARLGSTVFHWEELKPFPTPVGERRDVARNPTTTLEEFECHVSTLNPDRASHPPHTHPQEELIILREGTLDVFINGTTTRMGPGSLFFFAANVPHAVQNHGDRPATYFVFNFSTAATTKLRGQAAQPASPGVLGAATYEWEQLAAKPTPKGARRDVFDARTATLKRFECHVTTLNPGEIPHPGHHHGDEEIVLVKDGQLDVTFNGRTQTAGPGSIVLAASNDEHGWRNSGATPATYYVLRVRTERTP